MSRPSVLTVVVLAISLGMLLPGGIAEDPLQLKDFEIRTSWPNLTIDESCDPAHPSNWWNIKMNQSISAALDLVCVFTREVVTDDGNFTAFKDEILSYRSALEMADTDNVITPYLDQISDEDLMDFFDAYNLFWEEYGNIVCDSAVQFLNKIDFITVGLTDTDLLDALLNMLDGYLIWAERNIPVQASQVNQGLWGLDRVDQEDLPLDNSFSSPGTGAGVHVYIIDTGINSAHNDYAGRVGNGYDIYDNDPDPEDCNGHGTHCACTALGTTMGIAREAILHGVRVLSCSGSGSAAGVIAGINWVAANHIKPAVASMSLGGGYSATENNAIAALYDAGVPVAVAAGNDNSDACSYSPASADKAFTVSSSTSSDARSSFSNYGSCSQIFAPGSGIKSGWIGGPDAITTISGTSMATPHVAGAMAVYLGLNPLATSGEVYQAMEDFAANDKISNPVGTPNKLLQIQSFTPACDTSLPENSNCVLSDWSAWSECSTANTCGYGTQTATKTVLQAETGCGVCFGSTEKTQPCIVQSCPQAEPTLELTTNSLSYKSFVLSPSSSSGSVTYEVLCTEDITNLPQDTNSHTGINLGDDASLQVPLTTPFTFFGISYNFMYICSNGFITFGSSDSPWSASASTHFNRPRISALFTDLNPTNGGAVSYANLADRAVVTWEAVPYYSNTASVSMQVELHYATGEITFNYGYVLSTTRDKIIGVSSGNGEPSGYVSTDFVSPLSCDGFTSTPTESPTPSPTDSPTESPTEAPTVSPTTSPTDSPTESPTPAPTDSPTESPTDAPTQSPTESPTEMPTAPTAPTDLPPPTQAPTTLAPTDSPTDSPTISPTDSPTGSPTGSPTSAPTISPSESPTTDPFAPTADPYVDLPQYLATPLQIFSRDIDTAKRRRSLLGVPVLNSGLLQSESPEGKDDGDGSEAARDRFNGISAIVGKTGTFYPVKRNDQAFTAWDYHFACFEDGSMMDHSSWTSLNTLDDDNFEEVSFANPVLFGGNEYLSFFVGSNGYITFEAGDSANFPSIVNHYSLKRISAAFLDLNPGRNGRVSWTDNTAATNGYVGVAFDDVVRYRNRNSINFEILVYVDGRVTITYGDMTEDRRDILVGISTGNYPQSFQNVFLSEIADPSIDCSVPSSVEAALALERRSPTQEFSTAASRRKLLGFDKVSEEELLNVQKGGRSSSSAASGSTNHFDLVEKAITFAPVDNGDAYEVVCTEDISDFPRNSEGSWTSLALGEDDSVWVGLDGSFTFFGNAYNGLYVGSNGYITLGRHDTTFDSHRYNHFRYPHISACFMDLSPGDGGTVQYKRLSDAIVLQFLEVPKYGSLSDTYSFQYEIYYNGHITLSWMKYSATTDRTIVGLSAGAKYGSVYFGDFVLVDINDNPTTCPSSFSGYTAMSSKNAVEYDNVIENAPLNGNSGNGGALNICPRSANFYLSVTTYSSPPPPLVTGEVPEADPPVTASASFGKSIVSFAFAVLCWFAVYFA